MQKKEDRIVAGNCGDSDDFNVCLSRFALLLNCDDLNQNNSTYNRLLLFKTTLQTNCK